MTNKSLEKKDQMIELINEALDEAVSYMKRNPEEGTTWDSQKAEEAVWNEVKSSLPNKNIFNQVFSGIFSSRPEYKVEYNHSQGYVGMLYIEV